MSFLLILLQNSYYDVTLFRRLCRGAASRNSCLSHPRFSLFTRTAKCTGGRPARKPATASGAGLAPAYSYIQFCLDVYCGTTDRGFADQRICRLGERLCVRDRRRRGIEKNRKAADLWNRVDVLHPMCLFADIVDPLQPSWQHRHYTGEFRFFHVNRACGLLIDTGGVCLLDRLLGTARRLETQAETKAAARALSSF